MYGFPEDLVLEGIVGTEIEQICLGRSDVQFRFGTERTICAQALVELLRGEELISAWSQERHWSNAGFQMLLGAAVECYAVLHERLLEIRLEGDLKLRLHDTSSRFESVQFYPEMVIV
jgi:phosphosulfolactate phosphohydrolase-like enzyme